MLLSKFGRTENPPLARPPLRLVGRGGTAAPSLSVAVGPRQDIAILDFSLNCSRSDALHSKLLQKHQSRCGSRDKPDCFNVLMHPLLR